MINVYYMHHSGLVDERWVNQYLNQQDIVQYKLIKSKKRANQFMLGRLMVYYALCSLFDLSIKQICIKKSSYGKPFLKDYDDFYFNISHSGDHIVCVVSDSAVGIDIELLGKECDSGVMKFLAEEEQQYLKTIPERDKCKTFFDIWTKKESYVKMVGRGLSISMHSFSVFAQTNCVYHRVLNDANVIGNVCSNEESEFPIVRKICVSELICYLEERRNTLPE